MNIINTNAEAWLLTTSPQQQCTVGTHELQEVIQNPRLHTVPLTPLYCQHILLWREHLVPTLHLGRLLCPETTDTASKPIQTIGVFAYQTQPGTPLRYGALFLYEQPKRIQVNDTQACPLPESSNWQPYTLSCFEHQGSAIPILALARLYTQSWQATSTLTEHPATDTANTYLNTGNSHLA